MNQQLDVDPVIVQNKSTMEDPLTPHKSKISDDVDVCRNPDATLTPLYHERRRDREEQTTTAITMTATATTTTMTTMTTMMTLRKADNDDDDDDIFADSYVVSKNYDADTCYRSRRQRPRQWTSETTPTRFRDNRVPDGEEGSEGVSPGDHRRRFGGDAGELWSAQSAQRPAGICKTDFDSFSFGLGG